MHRVDSTVDEGMWGVGEKIRRDSILEWKKERREKKID